jgi:hypothetical protein
MLSPLMIWKPLKVAAEATITEATAVATEAHREDTVDTDTAVAAPFKSLLAPLKIWKWLNITTKATTEAAAAAALGTETTGAAAVMPDPAADMTVTLDTVVVVINTKKAWQTSCKRSMLILKHRKQKSKTRKILRSNWFGILINCSFGFNKTISTLGIIRIWLFLSLYFTDRLIKENFFFRREMS